MNQIVKEKTLPNGAHLQLVEGDLTTEQVDAIVNAANEYLSHGGGVAGTISRKGGPTIQTESNDWVEKHGPVAHDKPAYTRAGNLPCRYVIHAVGPIWGEGREDEKLAACVSGSLRLADELKLASLALTAISTGIFGFPKDRAAKVILSAIREYAAQNADSGVKQIRVTIIDQPTVQAFTGAWEQIGLDR